MRYFHNDYNLMCHPDVLEKMQSVFDESVPGYGTDQYCLAAAHHICQLCKNDALQVHFLVGGTQTNLTVIDAALRPHQAAIGAASAHIHVHETGAIEATGHKVLTLPSDDGKITSDQIEKAILAHLNDGDKEHTVQPKLVYISDSTEWGTIYSLQELEAISDVCRRYGLYLFVDGARLGYALAAKPNDVTLADLARLTDVFFIGGTKQGTLFGEAVVISNPNIAEDFRYLIKQHGGMLAKGWLLGLQFEALLDHGLYFEVARHANAMADKIRSVLSELRYPLFLDGGTNQIFPILPDAMLAELSKHVTFSEMGRFDENSRIVRFCTSWGTAQEDVDFVCDLLRELSQNA